MSYELTEDDIRNSLLQSGIKNIPALTKPSFLERAGDIAEQYINEPMKRSGIPNMAANFLSAMPRTARNVINLPIEAVNKMGANIDPVQLPQILDPGAMIPEQFRTTPLQKAMGFTGELGGDVLSGTAAFKGLSNVVGMGARTPLSQRAALGALAGTAISNPDQIGGRVLGGIVGGSAPLIAGVLPSTIAKKSSAIGRENKQHYQALYNKIIGEASQDIGKMRVPEYLRKNPDMETFFKHTNKEYNAGIRRYMNNPTLKNAHEAQSDAGKIIRDISGKLARKESLSSSEHEALRIARDVQKRIRGEIHRSFHEAGKGYLSPQYQATTQGYARDVPPFNRKELGRFEKGELSASKAGKRLLSSPQFTESLAARQVPGIKMAEMLHNLTPEAKHVALAALFGATGGLGIGLPSMLRNLMERR